MFNKVLSIIIIITLVFSSLIFFTKKEVYAKDYGLENPRVSNELSTWDCIYFGHYPQSRDNNGGYKNEKIKWRVLSINGDNAFIIADKNLDVMEYNKTSKSVTWETSTLRSWINGYNSSSNSDEIDYTNNNFIDKAFSSSEQSAIIDSEVSNDGNGNDTVDKIYLLSETESEKKSYGFETTIYNEWGARAAKNTEYVTDGGEIGSSAMVDETGRWWLRSKAWVSLIVQRMFFVDSTGYVDFSGDNPSSNKNAIRPVLHLDLSHNNWSEAGTISSNDEESNDDTSKVDGSFVSGTKIFSGKHGYRYRDSYFDKKATEYQHSLATMSLCLAFATYGASTGEIVFDQNDELIPDYSNYDKNVKRVLTECGFADDERYEQYNFNEKPSKNSIGCVIGSKKIKDTTVIAVAVRSGGYEAEWASNLLVGNEVLQDHKGFNESANVTFDNVTNYINKKNITGKTKIWITGYSRGAAVATQTAAKLNNETSIGKDNIYAYGFATPAGAVDNQNPRSSSYNNIFNIIDFNDPVPLVAPTDWGFTRYGITKMFPYDNIGSQANYIEKLKNNMGEEYRVDEFDSIIGIKGPFRLGVYNRVLINSLAKYMVNRGVYVNFYQKDLTEQVGALLGKDPLGVDIGVLLKVAIEILPIYSNQYPVLINKLLENLKVIADVHANQKYYVYWMQMMDDNYEDSLPVKWGNKNYREVRVNCPVDVDVYDRNNNRVTSIRSDKPINNEGLGVFSYIDENSQKIIYLPIEEEYDVKITAREKCEVSCGVEEYKSEFGDESRIVNFKDVTLNKSQELDASIEPFSDEEIENGAFSGSDAEYSLTKLGSNVAIDSDIKGKENIENHSYNVEVEYDGNQGTVYGGGVFTEGSYAKLDAESKEGYEFEGFYIDNKRIKNSGSEYERNSVRFKVEDHTKVVAKFNKTKVDKETTNNTKPDGIKKTTARNTNVKLAKPSIKKIKARKKSLKVFWKKKKGISGYKLQYSLKKSFKKAKTIIIKKPLKRTKLIKKLKRHKKYFLRIRTFKIVGSKMYLSAWSKRKIKRTK